MQYFIMVLCHKKKLICLFYVGNKHNLNKLVLKYVLTRRIRPPWSVQKEESLPQLPNLINGWVVTLYVPTHIFPAVATVSCRPITKRNRAAALHNFRCVFLNP